MRKCLLMTTSSTHSFMVEQHGMISEKGCYAAQGRGLKDCRECIHAISSAG